MTSTTQDMLQNQPLYERTTLARMLHMDTRTIKRWFEGYNKTVKGVQIHYPAWMHQPEGKLLSFTDLIELWFVQQFQKHRVPLSTIRSTYRTMSERLKCDHPFLRKNLWLVVSKKILVVDIARDLEATISEPESNQLYLDQIVLNVGNMIEFDDQDFARQWYPLGRQQPVVVDPMMGYGEPTIKGRRLRTRDVFNLWKAEGENTELVSEAYEITPEEVKAAVAWETYKN